MENDPISFLYPNLFRMAHGLPLIEKVSSVEVGHEVELQSGQLEEGVAQDLNHQQPGGTNSLPGESFSK